MDNDRMKPIIILPPDTMSKEDMEVRKLRTRQSGYRANF